MRRTKGAGRRSGMNISAMLHMRAHEGHLGRVCFPLLLLVLLLLLLFLIHPAPRPSSSSSCSSSSSSSSTWAATECATLNEHT